MSQNKTVIQGLEPDKGGSSRGPENGRNFYAREQRQARGTVVPGMMNDDPASIPGLPDKKVSTRSRQPILAGKPIIGFLYSISRTPMGECWPLVIGPNTIGKSKDCDIYLPEATVSTNHAVLVTRQVRGGVIAAITDATSSNGTKINGETIGFSAEECHNGDVITIGKNYELYLMLVDAEKMGLSVSKDFIDVSNDEDDEEEDTADDFPSFNHNRPTQNDIPFNPYRSQPNWGQGGGSSNATVGLDGSSLGANGYGGTVPM